MLAHTLLDVPAGDGAVGADVVGSPAAICSKTGPPIFIEFS